MSQYWILSKYGLARSTHFSAPADYVGQLSSECTYRAVVWAWWDGPYFQEHWSYCHLTCEWGEFYVDFNDSRLSLTAEQAMIYYEHYGQLARCGNWTARNSVGWHSLDKWIVGHTQLRYDGKSVKLQLLDMVEFSEVIGEPTADHTVYTVLSASLAMSELW